MVQVFRSRQRDNKGGGYQRVVSGPVMLRQDLPEGGGAARDIFACALEVRKQNIID